MRGLRNKIKINSKHFADTRQCFNSSMSPGEMRDEMNEDQERDSKATQIQNTRTDDLWTRFIELRYERFN